MSDMESESKSTTSSTAAAKINEPAEVENDILQEPSSRAQAVQEAKEVEKSSLAEPEVEKLPKLSAAEFRIYNSMAEHMEYFHNHFRQSWTLLQNACTNNRRPQNLSLRSFIQVGLQFTSHLSTHHAIEEQHIFPHLARKMPEFRAGKNAAELLKQHEAIHRGMDVFEAYLLKCRSGEVELELRVLGEKMKEGGWGEVLWKHLEEEVRVLGAENMRRYWSLEEMRRMPM